MASETSMASAVTRIKIALSLCKFFPFWLRFANLMVDLRLVRGQGGPRSDPTELNPILLAIGTGLGCPGSLRNLNGLSCNKNKDSSFTLNYFLLG